MKVIEKTIASCGYCTYAWALRIPDLVPKMCPRCKKRFSNSEGAPGWANQRVVLEERKFKDYNDLRAKLKKMNE